MLALEPLGVRLPRRDLLLQLGVGDDPALLEIDEEELAGLQPALAQDVLRRDVEHAGFGREHDPAVARLEPAARSQAVAVERRADHAPVREGDRGRPVPRLGQALVERVEAAQLVRHVGAAEIRLGDHHHQRVRERAAREHEQLEHVVEDRGVRAARTDDREDLGHVVAEELRGELRLARPHPVDVAAQRVDLAVVGDQPVGMRELPAREGVRREARVDERERARDALVAEVGEVAPQLRRRQHPLVDDRPRREARDHEVGAGRVLGDAPDHVQLPLERVLVELVRRSDEELADAGCEEPRGLACRVDVDRDVAPAEQLLPLGQNGCLEQLLELDAATRVLRQEADGDAVGPGLRQRQLGREQVVRDADQEAGAVARVGIRAGGAAVLEVLERVERAADRLVRGRASSRATKATPHASCSNRGS